MDPDFWHERWQDNQIGFHQSGINPYLLRFWPQLGIERGQRVFVPMCGKSLDMLWLQQQGYPVTGVEISRLAVEAFFTENDIMPAISRADAFIRCVFEDLELLCGDFFALTETDIGKISVIYDRAALIALPAVMRRDYVARLASLMATGTRGLLITLDYNQEEMQGPPFSVTKREVRHLFEGVFPVRHLCSTEVLGENPRFMEKGLTRLTEHAYSLGD
jgi:thiopurine S-methyltransferase